MIKDNNYDLYDNDDTFVATLQTSDNLKNVAYNNASYYIASDTLINGAYQVEIYGRDGNRSQAGDYYVSDPTNYIFFDLLYNIENDTHMTSSKIYDRFENQGVCSVFDDSDLRLIKTQSVKYGLLDDKLFEVETIHYRNQGLRYENPGEGFTYYVPGLMMILFLFKPPHKRARRVEKEDEA